MGLEEGDERVDVEERRGEEKGGGVIERTGAGHSISRLVSSRPGRLRWQLRFEKRER